MLPTKCSTKCVNQILIQIFVIYFHNLLRICFSRFVVLCWKLLCNCNMAHFGDLERLRKDFDIKFGILKLLFGEGKIVGIN